MTRSPPSRRDLLHGAALGFGALALEGLRASKPFGGPGLRSAAPARSVIFLFMDGGVSQVDSFDPKPRLDREHGQPIGMKIPATQFADVGKVLRSPWKFHPRGQSGIEISDLFPKIAERADDLCVIRSMTSKFSEHTSANYFLHSGNGQQGRPSMGAWWSWGLGSECEDLPGFIVLDGGLIPPGGLDNFGSGFLPASAQASRIRPGAVPLADLGSPEPPDAATIARRELLRSMDRRILGETGDPGALDAAIANHEMAYRMQMSVPGALDLRGETAATKALYGFDHPDGHTRTYATLCLLARRLVEKGVRFIELTCPPAEGDRWDQHQKLAEGHANNARAVDQPIAALLTDLKSRGLLESTLVVFTGEFGRTPMAQGADGRDHNPYGFSLWMAGGGVRGGMVHGATDDYGYFAVENRQEIHDLHATMLHLFGADHRKLTHRFGGRDMRLTDVHGEVIHPILC